MASSPIQSYVYVLRIEVRPSEILRFKIESEYEMEAEDILQMIGTDPHAVCQRVLSLVPGSKQLGFDDSPEFKDVLCLYWSNGALAP
jgi:sensor domain CHASE-containing protein